MDIIKSLSKGTVNLINKHDLINKTFTQVEYTYIENLIKKYRPKNKEVKINEELVKQLCENGVTIFYSELFKYLIVLSIAYFMDILLPTFFIMNTFSILRGFAGGVHMSTFNKCFATMIFSFLSLGYTATLIPMTNLIAGICFTVGLIWSVYIAAKYAPQERQDKSDKDCDSGNIKKKTSILFIVFCNVVSVMLFKSHQMISISVIFGILLEVFTITPIGIKFFKFIDGGHI